MPWRQNILTPCRLTTTLLTLDFRHAKGQGLLDRNDTAASHTKPASLDSQWILQFMASCLYNSCSSKPSASQLCAPPPRHHGSVCALLRLGLCQGFPCGASARLACLDCPGIIHGRCADRGHGSGLLSSVLALTSR